MLHCVCVHTSDQPFGVNFGVGEGIVSKHLHTYAGGQCWFSSCAGGESEEETEWLPCSNVKKLKRMTKTAIKNERRERGRNAGGLGA